MHVSSGMSYSEQLTAATRHTVRRLMSSKGYVIKEYRLKQMINNNNKILLAQPNGCSHNTIIIQLPLQRTADGTLDLW
jgi:hypothetical protein